MKCKIKYVPPHFYHFASVIFTTSLWDSYSCRHSVAASAHMMGISGRGQWEGEGDGGVNITEVHYMHAWKWDNETHKKLLKMEREIWKSNLRKMSNLMINNLRGIRYILSKHIVCIYMYICGNITIKPLYTIKIW
jgi:hypothetical protein